MKNMTVRRLSPEDLTQYDDLLRYAFQVTEKTLADFGWETDDMRKSKFPVLERASVIGWFDRGKLASQFAVYPLQMNVFGRLYDIGFVTSVATYPEYAGMGLMSRLMAQSLEEMRDKGQCLSLLYPYSIPLYRYKGWEIISDKMSFRIRDSQLPRKLQAPGYVRRVDNNSPDLLSLHNCFARKTHGCIIRNELAWEEYWRWAVEDTTTAIYYDAGGVPTGYVVYLLKEDIMTIKEMVYLDVEAWRGLWKFVGAHESMVNEVRGDNYSGEPVAFWLDDSEIKETIRPYIMGRVVDLERFIGQYRFTDIKREAKITFAISDPVLEWNNRRFTLQFRPGAAVRMSDGEGGDPVALDIGTFTSMMLGYKRPTSLARMERLAVDTDTVNLLESVIPREKAYISDYI